MKRFLCGLFGGILIAGGVFWILFFGLGLILTESPDGKPSIGHLVLGAAYILIGLAFVVESCKGGKKSGKKDKGTAAKETAGENPAVLPFLAMKEALQDQGEQEKKPAAETLAEEEEEPQEGEAMDNVDFGINRQYKCSNGHKKYCLSTLVANCRQNDEWLGLKHDESDVCDVDVFYTLDTEKGLHIMFAPAGKDWRNRYDREQKTPWRIIAKCGPQRWSAGVCPVSGEDYHAGLDVIDPRFIATVTASLIAGKDVDFLIRSGASGFSIMGTISAIERFRFTTMFCGLLTSQWNEYLEIGQLDRIHVAVARIQMDAADRNFEATKEFYERIYDLILILCKRDPREHVVAYDDWNNPDIEEKNRKPEIRTYAERDVDNSAKYDDVDLPIEDCDMDPSYDEDPDFAGEDEYLEEPELPEDGGQEEPQPEESEYLEEEPGEPEKEDGERVTTYF